jgi:hypothetical protein
MVLILRLLDAGGAGLPSVQGSVTGSAPDFGVPEILEPNGVTVSFAGPTPAQTADVTGAQYGIYFLSGTISGNILFGDAASTSKSCSHVGWSVFRQS